MKPNSRLIPITLLVAMTTGGCATLRQNPGVCQVATSLVGATLGGVGGGVGVDQIEKSPDDGERAAGAGAGAVVGALIGFGIGHLACEPERTPPPRPAVMAPPRTAPGTKLAELKAAQFDFNKAVLKPDGKARVDEAARTMAREPDLKISIEGHTDSVGSDSYNTKLGERRAQAVKAYLVRESVSPSRISVRSFGESRPVSSNATPAGRADNRRVELIAE